MASVRIAAALSWHSEDGPVAEDWQYDPTSQSATTTKARMRPLTAPVPNRFAMATSASCVASSG
jgi:hypothetical protein